MSNLANMPPLGLKAEKPKADPDYLARVRQLRCVVCVAFGEQQFSPTHAHHVIHGRFSQRKTPDCMAIPLCQDHHQTGGNGKSALHHSPAKWKRLYGEDHEYIAITQDQLNPPKETP